MNGEESSIALVRAEAEAAVSTAHADLAVARAETMKVRALLAAEKLKAARAKAAAGGGGGDGDDVRAECEARIATMQDSYEQEVQALQDEIAMLRQQIAAVGAAAAMATSRSASPVGGVAAAVARAPPADEDR